jgi:hypothetical protein
MNEDAAAALELARKLRDEQRQRRLEVHASALRLMLMFELSRPPPKPGLWERVRRLFQRLFSTEGP